MMMTVDSDEGNKSKARAVKHSKQRNTAFTRGREKERRKEKGEREREREKEKMQGKRSKHAIECVASLAE